MAQGQNTRAIYINLFTAIPAFVHLAELLFGKGSGADKKAAVQGAVGALLAIGGQATIANNPNLAPVIGQVIDASAGALFPNGTTVWPERAP